MNCAFPRGGRFALPALVLAGLTTVLLGQAGPMTIPAIVRRAKGAVLLIEGTSSNGATSYQGTGFLVRSDGVVATNYHVIAKDASAVVKLPDGAYFPVQGVLAADARRDLALLKVDGTGLPTLRLGDSDGIQIGQAVVAIGNPMSLESTVSTGIISGLRDDPSLGGRILQITAPISHGSSGGPLLDLRDRVVGITSMYINGGENLNFAIPINALKPLLSRLSSHAAPLPGGAAAQPEAAANAAPENPLGFTPDPRAASGLPPAGGCQIGGVQRTADFCTGYWTGFSTGEKAGFEAATIVTRPSGQPSLYVDSTVSDGDIVGANFVYALKSDIAESPLYSLAPDASSADFDIVVVTVAPDQGEDTAGAVVITCGGSAKIGCAAGQIVDTVAFVAGLNAVGSEAQSTLGRIDQTISSLPAQQ